MTAPKKEPTKADLTPESVEAAKKVYSQQDFVDQYNNLCRATGWMIIGQPGLRQLNDFGGAVITVQLAIVPYQEPPK